MMENEAKFTVSYASSLSPSERSLKTNRNDLDFEAQKNAVASSRRERMAKLHAQDKASSLYGKAGLHPQDETGILEFNRHALRLLVLEAHRCQVEHRNALAEQREILAAAGLSPLLTAKVSSFCQSVIQEKKKQQVSEQQLDLSQRHNVTMLTQDIDTLLDLAYEKNLETRGRILQQMYSQLAKLCMWNLQGRRYEEENGIPLGNENEEEISMVRSFSHESETRKAEVQLS